MKQSTQMEKIAVKHCDCGEIDCPHRADYLARLARKEIQHQAINDPNVNFGMYEADRVAKAKAQPQLPSVTDSGKAPSFEAHERNAITDRLQAQFSTKVKYLGCESETDKQRVDAFHNQVLQYTAKEKLAASIVDQLCPIIADETKAHIRPSLFNKLTVRLTELL